MITPWSMHWPNDNTWREYDGEVEEGKYFCTIILSIFLKFRHGCCDIFVLPFSTNPNQLKFLVYEDDHLKKRTAVKIFSLTYNNFGWYNIRYIDTLTKKYVVFKCINFQFVGIPREPRFYQETIDYTQGYPNWWKYDNDMLMRESIIK